MKYVVKVGSRYVCKDALGKYYQGALNSSELVRYTQRNQINAEAEKHFKPGQYQIVELEDEPDTPKATMTPPPDETVDRTKKPSVTSTPPKTSV
jgi:hypothetical protein